MNRNEFSSVFMSRERVLENLHLLDEARNRTFAHPLAVALDCMGKQFQIKKLSSPEELIAKYKGAGHFQIAQWLAKQADAKGMQVHLLAETLNNATVGILPQAVERAACRPTRVCTLTNNCDLVVHYQGNEGDMGVTWKLGNPRASKACTPLTWSELVDTFKKTHGGQEPTSIVEPEKAQESWMRYAWQLALRDWTPDGPKFTLNILSGDIQLEGRIEAKDLPSLKVDKIVLSADLAVHHPNEVGRYYVDGKERMMTHGEAFTKVSSYVRELFSQPDTFIEELTNLVAQRKDYVEHVMEPVFMRLMRVWNDYKECQTLQALAHKAVSRYLDKAPELLTEADTLYQACIDTLIHGEDPGLDAPIRTYQQVLELAANESRVPVEILMMENGQ